MPSPMTWCKALRAQLDAWAGDRERHARRHHGGGRARLFRRRRYPRALRSRPKRPARRGAAILARRISAQCRHQELSQALRRADRRHGHGRRRRRLGARLAPRCGRPILLRHAGSRHRLLPRRRRDLVPAADAGRARHLLRVDRRALRCCRCGRRRHRHPPRSVRPLCRAARWPHRHAFPVDAVLAAFSEPAGEGPIQARRAAIDRLFAGDQASRTSSTRSTARRPPAALTRPGPAKPPPSSAPNRRSVSRSRWQQVRRGKEWDFAACMRAEFRIVSRIIRDHDFYEGVRAVIVDKDNKPRWQPATLADVTDAEVERHFAPLGASELVLP